MFLVRAGLEPLQYQDLPKTLAVINSGSEHHWHQHLSTTMASAPTCLLSHTTSTTSFNPTTTLTLTQFPGLKQTK